MKGNVSPAVAAVIVVVVIAVVVALGWKSLGPRTDGPDKPINMGEMMKKAGQSAGPPPGGTSPSKR